MPDVMTCPECGSELPSNAPAGICPRCLMQAALADSSDEHAASADSPYAETTPQRRGFLPPESGALAHQFPHLQIMELLGQGGMGAVYKARQPKLDRLVALKIIRPESADDPAFAERFNREAKTLARLNHPNIVGVHDFGEVKVGDESSGERPKTLYYFLMEYVDGANLRQLMDRGEMDPERAMKIVPQICDALQYAHDEGIVHRDIKPENILIDSRGRVKIADFGLAKLASPSEHDFTLTGTHQVMGTPRYMAPEQMAGLRTVDHRADLYSLGVVFYEMLTGQVPAGIFDRPSKSVSIDERLDDVVMKSLAHKPEDRFQSASEIRSSLEAISSGESGSIFSAPEPVPARGFSTIFEREVGAAWNWVVHPEKAKDDSGKAETASFPRLLLILLAVLGGLTMFLPWAEIHLDMNTDVSFVESGATLTRSVDQLYPGTSVWSSAAAGGVCFLFLIVLILIPHRRSPGLIAAGLMTLFSLASFGHTLAYQNELPGVQSVTLPLEFRGASAVIRKAMDENESGDAPAPDPQSASNEVYPDQERVSLRSPSLFEHVTYREGFYASLGISLSLLLFSIISVRNAVLNREPKPETTESWSGTPLASLRFQVPAKGELGSKVRFHFLGLGYELVNEQAGTWIFQRGTTMGGMLQTDIRAYPTRLSVNSMQDDEGQYLVNCHWSVRLMGGWAGKSDIRVLEEEGRELESLLRGGSRLSGATAVASTSVESAEAVAAPVAAISGRSVQPAAETIDENASAGWVKSRSPETDLSDIEEEVNLPAYAMMVVGLVMAIAHFVGMVMMLEEPQANEFAWMAIPGILCGLGMLAGGLGLQGFRSHSWAQVGIVAGFLPVSPAFVFTMIISALAMNALSKPQIRLAFRERKSRKWDELKRRSSDVATTPLDLVEIEDEVSGPAIAMVIVGAVEILGTAICTILLELAGDLFFEDVLFLCFPPILIGIAMCIGGLCLKRLSSRAWAQTGIVAGMLPVTPAWIVTVGVCVWAQMTIRRKPGVKRAFLERTRHRVEQEVSGPAIAMMAVGFMMILAHGIAGLAMASGMDPTIDELAVMAVPGVFVGVAMLIGGFFLHELRSQSWAQVGIIAGFLPLSPAFILTMMTSIIALNALTQPQVKLAFRKRKNRRWDELKRLSSGSAPSDGPIDLVAVEDQVSVPAITMIVTGALMFLGHLMAAGLTFVNVGVPLSVLLLIMPGLFAGLLLMIGGLQLRKLGSRGWAQVGMIAGMLPVSPLWILSIGVSIWAQMLIGKPEVKRAFLERRRREGERTSINEQPAGTSSPEAAGLDLIDVEQEVSGPAMALMVVGALELLGNLGLFLVLFSNPYEDELAPMALPGLLVGLGMLVSGFHLSRLRSLGVCQIGAVAGLIPNPGWILSLPTGIWALRVMTRQNVKQVFAERARHARRVASVKSRDGSVLRSSTLIALAVWSAIVVVGGMASFAWLRNDLASYTLDDKRAGTLVPNSGAYKHVEIRAIGRENAGDLSRPDGIPLSQIVFELEPLPYSHVGGSTGKLTIELPSLAYAIGMRGNTDLMNSYGLDPDVFQQWMQMSGVDLNVEGVQKEARALFEIADKAAQTPPHELVDHDLFTVTPGDISKHIIPYREGQHARYCLFVWLGGVVLIVLVTHSRRNTPFPSIGRLIATTLVTFAILIAAGGLLYLVLGTGYTVTEPQMMDTAAVEEAAPQQTSSQEMPPLHVACFHGDVGKVKQLLDEGAGVNDKDPVYGQTPLMFAAGQGHTSLAATLILLGADLNEKDKQGQTALMFAVENHHEQVRKAIEKLAEISQIKDREERQEKLKSFPGIDKRLTAGLDVDLTDLEVDRMAQDVFGESVLMKAVKSKNVTYLREADYDYRVASLQDKQGRTALMHAIALNDPDFVKQIHELGQQKIYLIEGSFFVSGFEPNPMFDPRTLGLANAQGDTALRFAERQDRSRFQRRESELIREDMQRLIEIASRDLESEELQANLRKPWLGLRGHAYRALGETDKAEADFKAANEQS